MATKNLVDDTSTTVTTATPGVQLDLRYRTTLSRAALGVPVRFWAYASSTVANDTGTVQILDSAGAAKLTIPINGSTAKWYAIDGYLPATDSKYDLHYGGNTLGSLSVYATSLYEYADISPLEGVLASTIAAFTLSAAGEVGHISGDLTQTIAPFTLVATGTVAGAWTSDATSGKGVPADATEWAAFHTSAGVGTAPDHLWLMQEASGDAADTLTPAAPMGIFGDTRTYQQAVTGWDRDAVAFNTTASFRNLDADLPNPSATSVMYLLYLGRPTTPAATRAILTTGIGNASGTYLHLGIGTDNKLIWRDGNTALGTGGTALGTGVTPIIVKSDRTNSVQTVYTHDEKITTTYHVHTTDKVVWLGNAHSNACEDMQILYAAMWTGSDAELSDANVKTILQTLGWTVPWS